MQLLEFHNLITESGLTTILSKTCAFGKFSFNLIMVFLLYEPNFWIVNPYSSSQTVQGVRMGVLVSFSVVGGHMEHGLTLGFYTVLPGI